MFVDDPEIGGRYSALSSFGIVPGRAGRRRRPRGARGRRRSAAENCQLPGGQLRPLARRRARRARRASGRDKLTFVVDPPIGSFGLWAEQLVAESTGKQGRGHPADRRRAARRPAAPTGTTACSCTCATPTTPDPQHARAVEALAAGRPPDDHASPRRARRPRADLLLLRVRDRGGRLGAGDQPVRPAQRAGGEGQHGRGARGGRAGRSSDGRADRAARRPRPRPGTWRSWATCRTTTRSTPRSRELRAALIARTASPPRGATARASCTRPASSTRAARRSGASSSSCTTPSDRPRGPRRALRVPHADRRPGRRRPADAALARPARRARAPPGRRPRRRHREPEGEL